MFDRAFASESMSVHSAMMQKVRSPALDNVGVLEAGPISLYLLVGIEEVLFAPGLDTEAYGVECGHGVPLIIAR